MYRLNLLSKKVLITTDEVVAQSHSQNDMEVRKILPSIIPAEERFVRPAIGFAFYQQLIDEKNKTVTEENKSDLETAINSSLPAGAVPVTLKVGSIVNSAEFLTDANKALWYEYLWKLAAESVSLLTLAEGYVQQGAVGTFMAQPPAGPINNTSIVSPDLKSLQYVTGTKQKDRIDPLVESMHLWICYKKSVNKGSYPLYVRTCPCDELPDGISTKRKTQFLTDIYDDETNGCCS